MTMLHIDTSGMVNAPSDAGPTQPGFTVWPAQSPGTGSFNTSNGGTEYFLSSNAADEATHPVAGHRRHATLEPARRLDADEHVVAEHGVAVAQPQQQVLTVGQYALPPKQQQPGSGTPPTTATPQGHCINDTTTATIAGVGCWRLLFGGRAGAQRGHLAARLERHPHAAGDVRERQAVGRARHGAQPRRRRRSAPASPGTSSIPTPARSSLQGYLGATGYDFTYPAIGVTPSGRGVMAFTATGDTLNPSAAYAAIDANAGVGPWNVVPGGEGAAQDDGFTSYKAQVGEPAAHPLGRLRRGRGRRQLDLDRQRVHRPRLRLHHVGRPVLRRRHRRQPARHVRRRRPRPGPRAALGNWSTRISKFTP